MKGTEANGACFDDRETTVANHWFLPVGGSDGLVVWNCQTRLVARLGRPGGPHRRNRDQPANLQRSHPPEHVRPSRRDARVDATWDRHLDHTST